MRRPLATGLLASGIALVAACAPPPAVNAETERPSIELLAPLSGEDVPLTREGSDLVLALSLAVDIDGLTFVSPTEDTDDVEGQGHFRFSLDGARVDEPESRFFDYRSSPNQFEAGDEVRLSVDLLSNTGSRLDQFPDWTDEVSFNVVAPLEPTAELRMVHASPDAGPVDIYTDGATTPLFRDLAFGEVTGWQEVVAAPLRVEVRAAGSDAASEPLLTDILDPTEGERLNGIASGFVEGLGGGSFRVLPVAEGWGNDIAGRARVRFVHAASDLPVVTIDGAGSQATTVAPFTASSAEGQTLDIDGGVRLEVLSDGASSNPLTSFTTPEVAEGDEILLIATGRIGSLAREPEGLRLLAIGPDGPLEPILQDPRLYVLHGSGDSGSLELCSGTQAVVANLLYSKMEPAQLSPGTYDLQIFNYPAGCTGSALNGSGNVTTFEAGERYLTLLTGEQTANTGEASIQAASFPDEFELGDEANAKVRFVHGASYSQVYVGVVADGSIPAPNVLTQPIAWRAASVEVSVGAGAVQLGIADAVGEPPPPYAPIVSFDYAAQGGERQWGIVAGDPTPDDDDDSFLQVLVVDSAPSEWSVGVVDVY